MVKLLPFSRLAWAEAKDMVQVTADHHNTFAMQIAQRSWACILYQKRRPPIADLPLEELILDEQDLAMVQGCPECEVVFRDMLRALERGG